MHCDNHGIMASLCYSGISDSLLHIDDTVESINKYYHTIHIQYGNFSYISLIFCIFSFSSFWPLPLVSSFAFIIFVISLFSFVYFFQIDGRFKINSFDQAYKTVMTLTITSVDSVDFGSYKCVAKNSLGETDGTIKLYRK